MAPNSASNSPLRATTSVRLGERVLARCEDGLLFAEYALFDVSDIVLRATDPVTVREVGYMTTAGDALERLDRAGVTIDLALEAARSFPSEVVAAYARGAAARSLAGQLGPQELFDGAIFSASAQRYEGAWLDLRALSGSLAIPGAPAALQALHLCAALSEVVPSTRVHMATAAATRNRRPGERTHQRVALESAALLPQALRGVAPPSKPVEVEPARDQLMRLALLARVRERSGAEAKAEARGHLAVLETALAANTSHLGPLTDPELRALDRRLASGLLEGVDDDLERLEHARGQIPGVRYLRARAALLRGEEAPRGIAQVLSEIVEHDPSFHEAALVAARTWLAAGEDAHARYYARRLFDDPSAADSERLVALEILEATTATDQSYAPPATLPESVVPRLAPPRVPSFAPLANIPPPTTFPPEDAPQRPPASRPSNPPETPSPATLKSPPSLPDLPVEAPAPTAGLPAEDPASTQTHSEPVQARVERSEPPVAVAGALPDYVPELVETLALPFGAVESSFPPSELPRTPLQARIALTRLSRELARDYRLAYGKTLMCNVLAIDAMQQHLMHRFAGAALSDYGVTWELRRHGALLSEIIARALGGAWVDVGPSEPGYWAMSVLPGSLTYPIGRVYRFVALGHHERDLVGYYLELESRLRGR